MEVLKMKICTWLAFALLTMCHGLAIDDNADEGVDTDADPALMETPDDDETLSEQVGEVPEIPDAEGDADGADADAPPTPGGKFINKKNYESLKKVLLTANVPFVDRMDKIQTALSDWFSKETPSIWKQVEEKVEEVFAYKTTSTVFSLLQRDFDALNIILEKGKGIDLVNDMSDLAAAKSQFFPQQHRSDTITFDKKWISYVLFYLRTTTLVHAELMRPDRPEKQKLKKCSYLNELASLRDDVIGAIHMMFKLRYQHTIKGKSWGFLDGKEHTVLKSTRYLNPHNRENYPTYGIITYEDTLTKKLSTTWLKNTKHYYFDGVIMDGMYNITSIVTGFYNDLIGDNCEKELQKQGCVCPKQIEDSEVKFPYKQDCYGKLETPTTTSRECFLPCGQYGGPGSYSCVTSQGVRSGRFYKPGATGIIKLFKISSYMNWGSCNKRDQSVWDKCMPIPTPGPSSFKVKDYVIPFKKKKMAAKENKETKMAASKTKKQDSS